MAAPGSSTPDPGTPAPGAPAPTPTPTPAPAISDWRASLPPEIQKLPSLEKFKDPGSLARSYVELQSKLGAKGVLLPKEGDAADKARFYSELGRPESADKYDLSKIEERSKEWWPKDRESEFLKFAWESGFSNEHTQAALSWFAKGMAADRAQLEQATSARHEKTMGELKQKWGAAFDEKLKAVGRLFTSAAGGPDKAAEIESIELADGSVLGDHPVIVEMFSKLSELIREDVLEGGKLGRLGMTPEEAQTELARIQMAGTEENKALLDRFHPLHDQVLARRADLLQMARPEEKK